MATPKLAVAASKGTHLPGPDDDRSDENFIYGGPENADGPAAARPECANNLKQIALAVHALDAGDPSSFQINSASADDMGRSFDLVFPTQTAFEQREGNPVATESLEIAHEGFLHGRGGGRDDGWSHQVTIDLTEPTAPEAANTPGALLFSFSSEPTWTAIAMAESGGNTDAHAPHGEDSLGLWQINIDPAQTDNPDTFDCSGMMQWASGPAVQTGAWVADVTYERAARPECTNNLKQIGLGIHAFDAGECNVDICAQNSPPASPAPDNSRGYTAGHFALELEGHNASPPVDYGTGSFTIANLGNPATIDASLVFDSTGGDRSTVLLPYIEQHGGEADDGGFVIDWTTGDGPKGGDTVGVIAIITPTEHGSSILEFSVENFPNNSPNPAPDGFGIDRGHMASSFELTFATQTTFPQRDGNAVATESLEIAHEGFLGDRDDGWCMATEIDFPENTNDDTSSCTSGSLAVLYALVDYDLIV
jgi:Lysozyme like domain